MVMASSFFFFFGLFWGESTTCGAAAAGAREERTAAVMEGTGGGLEATTTKHVGQPAGDQISTKVHRKVMVRDILGLPVQQQQQQHAPNLVLRFGAPPVGLRCVRCVEKHQLPPPTPPPPPPPPQGGGSCPLPPLWRMCGGDACADPPPSMALLQRVMGVVVRLLHPTHDDGEGREEEEEEEEEHQKLVLYIGTPAHARE